MKSADSRWPKQYSYPKERIAAQLRLENPVEFYRNFSHNERGDLVFAYPLTEQEAGKEPHYRVENRAPFQPTAIRYCDVKVSSQPDPEGVALRMIEWNESGRRIGLTSHDGTGTAIADRHGVHAVRWTWDAEGRLFTVKHLGLDGSPVCGPEGWHGLEWAYDDKGRPECMRYLGIDFLPGTDREGIAAVKWLYDQHGRVIEKCWLGPDGRPRDNARGYARVTREYTERGEMIGQTEYTERGKR